MGGKGERFELKQKNVQGEPEEANMQCPEWAIGRRAS